MASRNAMVSISLRKRVISWKSASDSGATRKPRCPSVVASDSPTSRNNASRIVDELTPYFARSASTRSLAPGLTSP